jgi:hypothetical protein
MKDVLALALVFALALALVFALALALALVFALALALALIYYDRTSTPERPSCSSLYLS